MMFHVKFSIGGNDQYQTESDADLQRQLIFQKSSISRQIGIMLGLIQKIKSHNLGELVTECRTILNLQQGMTQVAVVTARTPRHLNRHHQHTNSPVRALGL